MRNNIEVAVGAYRSAQGEIEQSLRKQRELIKRLDDAREGLPKLERACESVRHEREKIADKFVLGECTELEFQEAGEKLEKAEKSLADGRVIHDALTRQVKALETDLPKRYTELDLLQRQCWEQISLQFESKITGGVRETIRTIVAIGCQIGRTRQFILDCLFPNPSSGETQQIQGELREEYSLND
ncbi:MAG: hypothetical protein UZ01_03292 [Candidatus Brocadia sinica]|uniref:Uncharacterized protein n=1 Tax=Candidatus Brocadia sinica JPN1 TaxID=1197129 RepID=A0ABQ0JZE4_9BACT|nr:hypothetical protein [Candidatus Brocadia sinica]NOG40072.1 hypothetical protein [Planctomycetota bacterium]KXK25488.1 MAG: hypothetical protein UZ01_03292 [Candidatus Brocadia sinica]NOG42788.1 hypothetical protein [Planctomycetota bacterium]GAN34106.1 hypothetical protein BROSI_A2642 [Candidatus Brocadia sinica JPN1]GAN35011.1 hypothetical protein BROSI_A3557 [Candidatus Brocadia sinica JPN1]